jgi:hypothetical protein
MSNNELAREAALSAPPVSIAGLSLAGVSLQDWVLITTLVWLGCQIGWFAYSRYKDFRKSRKDK